MSRFFFFSGPPTTEIYTLSLHDALPILHADLAADRRDADGRCAVQPGRDRRSEEHTSELQSPDQLVCRLLLEKKNPTACSATGVSACSPCSFPRRATTRAMTR